MRFRLQALSFLLPFALTEAVAARTPTRSAAQQSSGGATGAVTAVDYQRAERFLAHNTTPLVFHRVRLTWLWDNRFWYRDAGP